MREQREQEAGFMSFFQNAATVRAPRSIGEGALKGFMLAGIIGAICEELRLLDTPQASLKYVLLYIALPLICAGWGGLNTQNNEENRIPQRSMAGMS